MSATTLSLSQIAADFDNDFANVLGEGEIKEFRKLKWNIRFLDVLDLKEYRKHFSGGEGLTVNPDDLDQVHYMFYLILRKSDPRLSNQDVLDENWKITMTEVGRLLRMKTLSDPETQDFLNYILIGSGLKETAEEQAESAKNV